MKIRVLFISLLSLLVIGAFPVLGANFTIANTGFIDGGGGTPTLGTAGVDNDGFWRIIACPAGSVCAGASEGSQYIPYITEDDAYPFGGGPLLWRDNDTTSQWISPQRGGEDYNNKGDVIGTYTYRITFDLTGFLPGTAVLDFRTLADNSIDDIRLNGGSLGFAPATAGFYPWTDFDGVTSGFQAGVNTLDFDVREYATGTPSGLRVEFLTATADTEPEVPEPATMGLMGLGLLGLGVFRLRRNKA